MQRYPLAWPQDQKRTRERKHSAFRQTMDKAQKFLHKELGMLGGTDAIVSSNVPVRQDGFLYANAAKLAGKQREDPGVAVYFKYKKQPVVLCCDRFHTVTENLYAIAKTVENLRAIERYGVSDFLSRSFTGFTAIPEKIERPWWVEMEFEEEPEFWTDVEAMYSALRRKRHPDAGGTHDSFIRLTEAFEKAKKEFRK